jgi:hypothetical protein
MSCFPSPGASMVVKSVIYSINLRSLTSDGFAFDKFYSGVKLQKLTIDEARQLRVF